MRFSSRVVNSIVACVALVFTVGCAGPKTYSADTWKLPPKQSPETAMLVGRIGLQGNDKTLILNFVTFQLWGKVYFRAGNIPRGEKDFVMNNNYFVVPNVKPGKYWFAGFHATGYYNRLPADKSRLIEVKPGEIKFIGSFDYIDSPMSSIRMAFGVPGKFGLKQVTRPTELEMMQWLLRTGSGSGWEPAVRQRIRQLGGRA